MELWARKFWLFLWKLHSKCPREKIGWIFLKNSKLMFFRTVSGKLSARFLKFFQVSWRTIWWKHFLKKVIFQGFLVFERIFFGAKNFREGCQNCILPVRKNNFYFPRRKKFSVKTAIISIFSNFEQIFFLLIV